MKQPHNPNPHLKKVAILAGVIGTVVGMYLNHRGRQAPPPRAPAPVEETRSRPEVAPPRAAPREASRGSAKKPADFDFYLLAMSVHRAFCDDGHERKPECRAESPRPLVIHGLWPEKFEPRAYPHDCPAPPLDLEPAFARELAAYMPGMQSGLHEHEWREHGGCTGMDDDEYFRAALGHARELDRVLGGVLTTNAGKVMTPQALRDAAERVEPGIGATFTLHCRVPRGASQRDRPVLMEVRQCLEADAAHLEPGNPFVCEIEKRRDQGCGPSFRVARE